MTAEPMSTLQNWQAQRFEGTSASVLVIGAGICGSTTAAVLAQAGWRVTLIDLAGAHDGHVAAALTPVISSDDNARSKLSRLGAQLADAYWRSLVTPDGMPVGEPCGALQLQRPPDAKRVQDLKAQVQAFDQPDWARWVDRDEASAKAGMDLPRGGIWYPTGWLIRVPELIAAMQASAGVTRIHARVDRLVQAGSSWQAVGSDGTVLGQASVAILANASDTVDLVERSGLQDALAACARLSALHRLAGEITLLPAEHLGGGPQCVVGGDGYVLPAVDGWCVSGGTYVRGADAAQSSDAGRRANVARAREILGVADLPDWDGLPGWAGWRAVLPGRLPAIGPMPRTKNLWVFTAGASRGLTWSVLGASLIRDALAGEPLGLSAELLAQIEP